jgi:formylglycine-generating enzyme required for sulfatase activity
MDNQSYAKTSNPIGTIAYMPPEAFDGNISFGWDMWSLGIMLVQMTAQRLPYQFSDTTQLLKRVMNCDLQLPPLPEEFKPIILGCLESDRTKRWTAEQALSALEPLPNPPPLPTVIIPPPLPTVVIKGNSYDERINISISGKNPELIKMISIPQGEFLMGSPAREIGRYDDEGPQHLVRVRDFYIAQTPITQAQWRAVANLPQEGKLLNPNPSSFKGDKRPVEQVSWQDALEFCARLSRHTGKNYRLPSEAEWEYACRAGTKTPFYFGHTISTDSANYDGNYVYGKGKKGQYRQETTEVGIFRPNNFGLYDMHGNVWEWCLDPWHLNYTGAPSDGRVWDKNNNNNRYQDILNNINVFIEDGKTHVLRGGSWYNVPWYCRSAYRNNDDKLAYYDVGFRLALSVQDSSPLHS